MHLITVATLLALPLLSSALPSANLGRAIIPGHNPHVLLVQFTEGDRKGQVGAITLAPGRTDKLEPYPKDGCPKRTNINNEHWDKGTGNTDISNAMGLPNADYPIFYAFNHQGKHASDGTFDYCRLRGNFAIPDSNEPDVVRYYFECSRPQGQIYMGDIPDDKESTWGSCRTGAPTERECPSGCEECAGGAKLNLKYDCTFEDGEPYAG